MTHRISWNTVYPMSSGRYMICYLCIVALKYVICAGYDWYIIDFSCILFIFPFTLPYHFYLNYHIDVICSRTLCKTAFGWWVILDEYASINKIMIICHILIWYNPPPPKKKKKKKKTNLTPSRFQDITTESCTMFWMPHFKAGRG